MLTNPLITRSLSDWIVLPRAVGDPLFGDFALGEFVRASAIDDLLIEVTSHPADAVVGEHSHPTLLLLFVLDGELEEIVDDRVTVARPGTLLVRPQGMVHVVRSRRRSRAFSIEPGPNWLAKIGATQLIQRIGVSEWTDRITLLALKAYQAFASFDSSPAAELVLQGYVQALLGELIQPVEDPGIPLWLRDVRRALDADPRQRLDLEQLARGAGVHPVHLSRTFRKYFGLTMTEHLRQGRLASAMLRLSTTDAPISEIAQQSGFSDASHFAREFRRTMGDSPAVYRGSLRERASS
jgi:AraC family transcriptional regulator